ncbi:hypothetical protein MSAN_01477700 [Mycena sanguinolenta]|uniref:Uncharacterized protein n=1 Tax=Mycena sanguinolenta TaxID=230812 RepID=A0A8H6Y7A4_9AGAR|nr:hypothetical protein MSAN_01477700 [Mycena sanguinolenta]
MEQGEKEKEVVDSPRLHLQLHLYPYERVHARGRSSSPGRTAERTTTESLVLPSSGPAHHVFGGGLLARLCVGQSGDVDQGFYTGKPVF